MKPYCHQNVEIENISRYYYLGTGAEPELHIKFLIYKKGFSNLDQNLSYHLNSWRWLKNDIFSVFETIENFCLECKSEILNKEELEIIKTAFTLSGTKGLAYTMVELGFDVLDVKE